MDCNEQWKREARESTPLQCSACDAFSEPDDHHAGPCDWMPAISATVGRTTRRAGDMLKLLVRKPGVRGNVWREYNDMPDVATAERMAAIMAEQGFETHIEDDPATYDAVDDRWYPAS